VPEREALPEKAPRDEEDEQEREGTERSHAPDAHVLREVHGKSIDLYREVSNFRRDASPAFQSAKFLFAVAMSATLNRKRGLDSRILIKVYEN